MMRIRAGWNFRKGHREHELLYVLELFADEAAPVMHVWKMH